MTHEPADLELVIDYHVAQSVESGHPPRNLDAWRNACRRDMLANEHAYPGYIERAAAGLRAKAQGKKLTRCREARGTHAVSHEWHPDGTDTPPAWWNPEAAKRAYLAEQEARRA